MYRTSVVVIGAGQAGLAVSHLLSAAGTDHVVLERGRAAARWDAHAWQSLRLLTPNWMTRLPGHRYRGPDPDGFMRAQEVGGYLRSYAALSAAPVTEGAEVTSVRRSAAGYRITTTAGTWTAVSVVLATGWCDLPYVPGMASRLDGSGDIRHRNGSTTSPGLHVVGMRWQTRRSSTFLDGVRHDAAIVVARVLADLDGRRATAGSAA
jgi:cation diffusion facilitator CzcD-associated flavoprotein CzcO